MFYRTTICLVLCSLVLCQCQRKPVSDTETTKNLQNQVHPIIEFERDFKREREVFLSELAVDIEYIKLEATPNSYIGRYPYEWHITHDYIYVVSDRKLLQFSRKGTFIREIGRYGKGPGEHNNIIGVDCGEKQEVIYLLSDLISTVFKYNASTGKLLDSFKIAQGLGCGLYPGYFLYLGKETLAILVHPVARTFPDNYVGEFIDTDGHTISKISTPLFDHLKSIGRPRIMSAPNQLWSFQGQPRFFQGNNDTIYEIEANRLKPKFIFNLGKYKGSLEYLTSNFVDNIKDCAQISCIYETKDYLLYNYIMNYRQVNYKNANCIFDKKTGVSYKLKELNAKYPGIINDLDGGLSFYPQCTFTNDNPEWVSTYEAISLKEKLTEEHFRNSKAIDPKKKEKLKQFIEGLSIEDNPVVVIVKMK